MTRATGVVEEERSDHAPARGERAGAGGRRRAPTGAMLLAARIGFGVVVVALWALADRLELISPLVMRSPAEVWTSLTAMVGQGELWSALVSTLSAALVALVLAGVVGISIGILLGLLPRVEAVVDPYLNAANAMPRLAFAPIFIVAFGIGQTSKVALAFSLVVFILITNARAGVRVIDHDILKMARSLGLSRRQTILKISLPSAVPSIFAGLRLGVIYSLLAVVGSELIAAREGVGQMIAAKTALFLMADVYALVFVLAVVGALLNVGTERIERRLLRWQTP